MAEVDGSTSQLLLGPDTMDFVRIWIDVPEVIDGAPLANQGPTFRLIGTSGLDGVSIAWDFTLEVSSFRNATIDAVQSDVVVDPDGNTRVDVPSQYREHTRYHRHDVGQSRRQRSCID